MQKVVFCFVCLLSYMMFFFYLRESEKETDGVVSLFLWPFQLNNTQTELINMTMKCIVKKNNYVSYVST